MVVMIWVCCNLVIVICFCFVDVDDGWLKYGVVVLVEIFGEVVVCCVELLLLDDSDFMFVDFVC